jgi:hypothetical protein
VFITPLIQELYLRKEMEVYVKVRERVGVKVMWVLDGVVEGNDTTLAMTCHRTTASTLQSYT